MLKWGYINADEEVIENYIDINNEKRNNLSVTEGDFCGIGTKYNIDSKICDECPTGTYQDNTAHRKATCTTHASRNENMCQPNTYLKVIDENNFKNKPITNDDACKSHPTFSDRNCPQGEYKLSEEDQSVIRKSMKSTPMNLKDVCKPHPTFSQEQCANGKYKLSDSEITKLRNSLKNTSFTLDDACEKHEVVNDCSDGSHLIPIQEIDKLKQTEKNRPLNNKDYCMDFDYYTEDNWCFYNRATRKYLSVKGNTLVTSSNNFDSETFLLAFDKSSDATISIMSVDSGEYWKQSINLMNFTKGKAKPTKFDLEQRGDSFSFKIHDDTGMYLGIDSDDAVRLSYGFDSLKEFIFVKCGQRKQQCPTDQSLWIIQGGNDNECVTNDGKIPKDSNGVVASGVWKSMDGNSAFEFKHRTPDGKSGFCAKIVVTDTTTEDKTVVNERKSSTVESPTNIIQLKIVGNKLIMKNTADDVIIWENTNELANIDDNVECNLYVTNLGNLVLKNQNQDIEWAMVITGWSGGVGVDMFGKGSENIVDCIAAAKASDKYYQIGYRNARHPTPGYEKTCFAYVTSDWSSDSMSSPDGGRSWPNESPNVHSAHCVDENMNLVNCKIDCKPGWYRTWQDECKKTDKILAQEKAKTIRDTAIDDAKKKREDKKASALKKHGRDKEAARLIKVRIKDKEKSIMNNKYSKANDIRLRKMVQMSKDSKARRARVQTVNELKADVHRTLMKEWNEKKQKSEAQIKRMILQNLGVHFGRKISFPPKTSPQDILVAMLKYKPPTFKHVVSIWQNLLNKLERLKKAKYDKQRQILLAPGYDNIDAAHKRIQDIYEKEKAAITNEWSTALNAARDSFNSSYSTAGVVAKASWRNSDKVYFGTISNIDKKYGSEQKNANDEYTITINHINAKQWAKQ